MKSTKIYILLVLILSFFVLSSCNSNNKKVHETQNTTFLSLNETPNITTINIPETDNITLQTANEETVLQLINNIEFPEISINNNSTKEEILQAGKTVGIFYSKTSEKYFGYGANSEWEIDYNDTFEGWVKCLGPYVDNDKKFVSLSGEKSKMFMIDYMRLTNQGYKELCENSPSRYIEKDNAIYIAPGEGGQAGWDYSYIIDYEMDANTITYNCARVGRKERWGYDEDLICPFTFRLALEKGVWKLDGCSYGEGLFYWFIGLENDIETYLANSEDWQENVINDDN